ncbi:hypothetical protein Dvina_52365 [Dactylosporangium vinaceum]|uniref:Glycosyltransferase RgtA/B/C/D-like domain-containing protein n=1 Tax=Dactylosporangium vinaceum TaxID=53362 RepID=A0ABV5MQL2_9ACTN|nr:hypothetical protein [Dactylosporangium vinaceum]UAB96425.1 hypothetical protein Dvina_52365 [Dactylosporangium vinaceum]
MTAAPKGAVAVRFAGPALLLATVFAVLWFYRVPPATTALFVTYLALGVTLPGTLWWRLGRGRREWLVADLAAGLVVGYIGEVFCYVVARLLGAPLLVLVFPLATVAVFALVPRWRSYFRAAPDPDRPSVPAQLALTALAGLTLVWSVKFFRVYGLRYPANASPDTDSPFHLALLGEAKHHMPMTIPWIQGEPLLYHWFVYPEMAATSWVTGIEPNVLLLRLSMLPMLMGFTVLVALLGRRVIGAWWPGVAASAVTLLVLAPNPYQWQLNAFYRDLAFSGFDDGAYLRQTAWTGPTQTFGALLFVPVMLVLVDLLRGSRRQWALFAVLLAGVTGGKATYLPLLAAGLGLLIVVRRLHRVALIALGATVVAFLTGMLLLFGASSQGTRLAPLTDVATGGIGVTTGFSAGREPWKLLVLALLTVLCWAAMWAGIALLRRPSPELVVMLGIGIAGAAATMLLGQDGDSQRYFLESARPYLCVAAVAGLARLGGRTLIAWAVVGVVAIQGVQTLGRNAIPKHASVLDLAAPYALLLLVLGSCWLIGKYAGSKYPPLRNKYFGHIMIFGLLLGFGVNTSVQHFLLIASESRQSGFRDVVRSPRYVSAGTLEAGHWLRDHSSPDDLVATNAHCLMFQGECSNLHFSMTAYSERRMLVEGWGFATTAHEEAARLGTWVGAVPYWKPAVLADNDAVFAAPTPANVDVLRNRYRVRWLFVDETQSSVSPRLADFAEFRYRSGVCVVYELPRP